MPAIINIVTGPQAGDELWIEYEVSRLGGDTGCELHLAGTEPHVLTIRYADNRYNVYNRGTQPITLDGEDLSPGQSANWRSGRDLKLADGTLLRMALTGDGAPTRRPADAPTTPRIDADVVAVEAPVIETAPKKKSNNLQLIAVVALFAVAAFVLLSGGGEEETTIPKKPFAEIAFELRQEEALPVDLWLMFNAAHVDHYRGREDDAKQSFERLRDRIEWEKNELLTEKKPIPTALTDAGRYVADQLAGEL